MSAAPPPLSSIPWQKVYAASRSQVEGRAWLMAGTWGLIFVGAIIWGIRAPVPNIFMLLIMVVGMGSVMTVNAFRNARQPLLVLEATLLKTEPWQRGYRLHLAVQHALTVTATGQTQPQPQWEGFQALFMRTPLQRPAAAPSLIRLVCLANGEVLGNLEIYLDG